jgi:oxaloacetate decarboxylase alpha subunit
MSEIRFIDTTLRDGQQSLWALGMKTAAMLPIASQMDRIGFESMEFFVSIMIKKYVREHKENPWDWLRGGTRHFRRTRLRNHGGLHGSGAFEKLPHAALRLLAERVVSYGITLTRTSNCWNDFEEMRDEVRELTALGMETVVNLIYTVSPRHSDEYYARKAREAAAISPYRICFKDVGCRLFCRTPAEYPWNITPTATTASRPCATLKRRNSASLRSTPPCRRLPMAPRNRRFLTLREISARSVSVR